MSATLVAPAPPDASARHRIRTALDETLFVEAGAGSGKTTMLVERILALVGSGVPLRSIAAITFTEKAATELRDRVRAALVATMAEADEPTAGSPWQIALNELDAAAVGTLHSFAQRLLREHPVEAGLPPAIEINDEVGSQIAFEARWRAMREELFADPSRSRSLVLADAAGARIGAFADVAAAYDDNWDLLDSHVPLAAAAPPPVAVDDLAAAGRALLAHRAEARCTDSLTDRLDALEAWCDALEEVVDDEGATLELLAPDAEARKGWCARRRGRKLHWPAGHQDLVVDELDALAAAVDARRTGVLAMAVDHLVAAIARFTLDGADQRRRRGRLEFHDLLVLARTLVRDRPDVRATLHDRYRRLLLDEFQDTDPIQVELAFRLAAPPDATGDWSQLHPEPGRLFVVGDPKQSIYRFRRADLATFLATRQALGDDPVPLDANFRTVAPIIDWLNHTYARLIRPEPGAQPDYQPLAATRASVEPGPAVTVLGAEPLDDGARADDQRAREAADVAAAITTILAEGWAVQDRPSGALRPARRRDITVLLPARTSLPALERALEHAGVAYRVESSSLVYGTPEIRALLLALRALDDPSDELALVATLRSPLFGCSDPELFGWTQRGGRWRVDAPRPEPLDDDAVGDAMAALARLSADRHWSTPSELLDRLVRERGLLELGFVLGRARDLWRRVRFVIDQARAWAEAGGRGLRAYLDWAYRQAAESGSVHVVEAVLPETDDDAVRLMTIHASKGLEFPITILSGLTTRPQRSARGAQVLWCGGRAEVKVGPSVATERFEESKALDEQLSYHERLRLLYVGCTRARDHLVVSLHRACDVDGPDPRATSAQLLAWASTGAQHRALVPTTDPAPPPPDVVAPEPWAWADAATWQAEHDRVARAARRPRTIAATIVAEAAADDPGLGTGVGDLDPGLVKDAPDLELPPWLKGRYGTAIGRAVHAVLQTVDLSTGAGLADAAAAQAAAEGVLGREGLIAALARSALRAPSVREAAALPHWRELYVATPVGDTVLEGYIDLLYRSALGLVVVDHKTDAAGREHDDDARLDQRAARYRLQGAAYALAVERVTGEPVTRVVFVFCSRRGRAAEREITDLATAQAEVLAALSAHGRPSARTPAGSPGAWPPPPG